MKHGFVDDPRPSAAPCARGCKIRDRHADHCTADTDTPCWGCLPRPAENGSPLCRRCGQNFTRGIAEMPALALELWRGLSASAGGVASGSAKMDGSPDFARARSMVEHVGQLAHDLAYLAGEVAIRRKITAPTLRAVEKPLRAVEKAAPWLTIHAPWMLGENDAPDWLATISEGRATAYKLIDRPARSRFDLPQPCPGKGTLECGAKLKVTMYDENDPRISEVWCTADPPHQFEAHQWLRLGRRLGRDTRSSESA